MASGIYLNESVWSSPLVGYNNKQNRRVVDLHWKKTRPDHAISSSVAIPFISTFIYKNGHTMPALRSTTTFAQIDSEVYFPATLL